VSGAWGVPRSIRKPGTGSVAHQTRHGVWWLSRSRHESGAVNIQVSTLPGARWGAAETKRIYIHTVVCISGTPYTPTLQALASYSFLLSKVFLFFSIHRSFGDYPTFSQSFRYNTNIALDSAVRASPVV
jgi:hypothetical protein